MALDASPQHDAAVSFDEATPPDAARARTDGGFTPLSTLRRAQELFDVAVADLDGDGRDDLVLVDAGGELFALLAASQFSQPIFGATKLAGRGLSLGDFDGDGTIDLVRTRLPATRNTNNDLVWQAGHGDGTFGADRLLLQNDYIQDVHALDVDGDGRLDVVAQLLSSATDVWLGHGDGSFDAVRTSQAPVQVSGHIAVADFDGDGKLDVAGSEAGPSTFSVLRGKGDGTFAYQQSFGSDWHDTILSGDVDGDGKPDLLLPGPTAAMYRGVGDGTFVAAATSWRPSSDVGLVIDFDRDRVLDLVTPIYVAGGATAIGFGRGHGNFDFDDVLDAPLPAQAAVARLAAGDLDGDGATDVVAAAGQSVVWINGDGWATSTIPLGTPAVLAVGDFDGDGFADVLGAQLDGAVTLFRGAGNGSLRAGASVIPSGGATRLALGDFNEDGRVDAVAGGSPSRIVLGAAGSGIALGVSPPIAGPPVVGDFNGDGHLDIVGCVSATPAIVLGHGDGSFGAPMTFGSGCFDWAAGVAADLDGDGHLDLVRASIVIDADLAGPLYYDMVAISVWRGAGDGSFSELSSTVVATGATYALAVRDLDGDGRLDVIFPMETPSISDAGISESYSLVVLNGHGDGTFDAPRLYPLPPLPYSNLQSIVVADLDGDGRLDVLTSDGQNALSLLRGGPSGLEPEERFAVGGATPLAVGDFDGDGVPDVVGTTGTNLVVWKNRLTR